MGALYEKARKTMSSASPGSLTDTAYANIVAHILEVNGVAVGDAELPTDGNSLAPMRIP